MDSTFKETPTGSVEICFIPANNFGVLDHVVHSDVVKKFPIPIPTDIDEYIAQFSPEVQMILRVVQSTIRAEAPDAEEIISYRMPAFRFHGILIYFAAFKQHIGLYPPVFGDKAIEKAIAPFAGPKGNLQFPLNEPIPVNLIRRIVKLRVKQNLAKVKAKRKKA